MKKLLALLLALVMVFSLAACAKSEDKDEEEKEEKTEQTDKKDKEDQEDKKDEEDAEEDEDADESVLDLDKDCIAYVESYADFIEDVPNVDTAKLLKYYAPALEYKNFVELMEILYEMDSAGLTEEMFLQELKLPDIREALEEKYGDDFTVETSVVDATAYTSAQLADLNDTVQQFSDNYQAFVDDDEGATEADWESMAAQDGVSVETEKRFIELCGLIAKELRNLEITEAYQITAQHTFTSDDLDKPDVQTGQFTVIKVNGEWMMLDGLAIYGYIHM